VLDVQNLGSVSSRVVRSAAASFAMLLAFGGSALNARAAGPVACPGAESWYKSGEHRFVGPFVLTRSQGVTHDDTGWIFSWQGGLERTNNKYKTRALATWPYDNFNDLSIKPDLTNHVGGSHIGDVDEHDGLIYAPIEDGEEGLIGPLAINHPEYQLSHVALYDAKTLLYTGVSYAVPQDLQRDGVPWIAIDDAAGEAYTGEWGMPRDTLNIWTLQMAFKRTLTLQYPASFGPGFHLSRIQGGEVLDGALYVARDDAEHTIFKIDLATGAVSRMFALGGAEPSELEGMAVYPTPDGALIHVLLITDNDFGDPTNLARVRASFQHFTRECL
jgi:hypothetical protein